MNNFPKIFLVDDDPFCLALYEQEITNLGFETVAAFSSGAELLSHLPENPDLVFIDYQLGDYNGLQLLKKIKDFNPAISVVVISGQQDMHTTVQLMNQGAFDYIIKDKFEAASITRLIGSWLSACEFEKDSGNTPAIPGSENYLKVITQAQDKVRSEISGELHDNVSQLLGASKLYMDVACRDGENRISMIQESRLILDSAISEVRKLSHSLHTKAMQKTDLAVELNKLISGLKKQSRFKLVDTIDLAGLNERFSSASQLEVYRMIQEIVNNINKYAMATEVTIRVELAADMLQIVLRDNGVGFEFDKVKKGLGLDNIIKRISNINGCYTIQTSPGQGCTWMIDIPVAATQNTARALSFKNN